jgi:hypothetical protein
MGSHLWPHAYSRKPSISTQTLLYEGPIRATWEGGSEWEPIKILPFGWIRPIPQSQLHEPTHTNKTPNRDQTTSKEPPRSLGTRSRSKQTRTEAQTLNCKSLGRLSVWHRRTVHEGVADHPATTRRLSEKALRTNRAAPWKIGLSMIEPRTVRTENLLADCPRVSRGPSSNHVQNRNRNPIDRRMNLWRTRWTREEQPRMRTVRHELVDRPPLTQKQGRELHKNNSNFQSMDLLNRWTDWPQILGRLEASLREAMPKILEP